MANKTFTVTKVVGGVSKEVTPTVKETLKTGQVSTRKVTKVVNGVSTEITVKMSGYTPAPGSE